MNSSGLRATSTRRSSPNLGKLVSLDVRRINAFLDTKVFAAEGRDADAETISIVSYATWDGVVDDP